MNHQKTAATVNELDALKIPAYMRKRSLSGKAKKPTGLAEHIKEVKQKAAVARHRNSAEDILRELRKPIQVTAPRAYTSLPAFSATPSMSATSIMPPETFAAPILESSNDVIGQILEGEAVGTVTHFYGKISVAVIKLTKILRVGDTVRLSGESADFEHEIDSMQIDRKPVKRGTKGKEVGIKIDKAALWGGLRLGSKVYKL